jgi:hypothetical protein
MKMVVLDLIKSSLRLIRVIGEGEEPNAAMASDAMATLRMMLDEWYNEDLMLYRVQYDAFPLVANQTSYTIGEQITTSATAMPSNGKFLYGQSSGAKAAITGASGSNYTIILDGSTTFISGEVVIEWATASAQGTSKTAAIVTGGNLSTSLLLVVSKSLFPIGSYVVGTTSGTVGRVYEADTDGNWNLEWVSGTAFTVGEQIQEYATAAARGAGTGVALIAACANRFVHRPDKIEYIFVTLNGVDYPVKGIEFDEYFGIARKTITSNLPLYYYYDQTFPNGTLYIYPVSSAANNITIGARHHFDEATKLSDPIHYPHGYEQAIRYNLSVELAPEYGKDAGPIMARAFSTKGNIKSANIRPLYNSVDRELRRRVQKYNIYIG